MEELAEAELNRASGGQSDRDNVFRILLANARRELLGFGDQRRQEGMDDEVFEDGDVVGVGRLAVAVEKLLSILVVGLLTSNDGDQ